MIIYGDLNLEEQKYRLWVAYEIITKVHSNLCRHGNRQNDIRYEDDTLEICQSLIDLISKMDNESAKNGLPTIFMEEE